MGLRFHQFYIGVLTDGPERPDSPAWREHMLPFAYWITQKRWLPKHYFDADGPEDLVDGIPYVDGIDGFRDVRSWTGVCLFCHNTTPYAYRATFPMFAGFPDAGLVLDHEGWPGASRGGA